MKSTSGTNTNPAPKPVSSSAGASFQTVMPVPQWAMDHHSASRPMTAMDSPRCRLARPSFSASTAPASRTATAVPRAQGNSVKPVCSGVQRMPNCSSRLMTRTNALSEA